MAKDDKLPRDVQGMSPGNVLNEYALRCNLAILRHNFEQRYCVCTNIIASG